MASTLNVAVEGCCHGDLDRIYDVLGSFHDNDNTPVDFMICCGDFQAIRTHEELETLACPPVYRHMKDFHKYWSAASVPRCLTLFIGGNHEAPGHLREMYFGGFASKDIFYLGSSGVFNVGGLRIAALSGIFKYHDYDKPIFEAPPYTENTKRSAYHVRRYDIEKLKLISQPVDIVISHDWPRGITNYGDTEHMLRLKDRTGQLRQEINSGQLGNPHTMDLLKILKPKYWFAGHMHVKYAALYEHPDGSVTRFLALDKCIPRRPFVQLLGIEPDTARVTELRQGPASPPKVRLDPEWLAILKVNNAAMPVGTCSNVPLRKPTFEDIQLVNTLLSKKSVSEFPYFGQIHPGNDRYRKWICDLLEMTDRIDETSAVEIPAAAEPAPASDNLLFFED